MAEGFCAHHNLAHRDDYRAFHEDAERRTQRGERQTRCPTCKRWLWAHESGTAPARSTAEEGNAANED